MNKKLILGLSAIGIVVLGAVAGVIAGKMNNNVSGVTTIEGDKNVVQTENEVGSTDVETFGDTATGKIEEGGLGNEGTHKLIRDGGPSQTVYLISSIVDLDQFVGKSVQIWGQTIKAQKASWLMDVGRVKIVQ